MSKYRVSFYHCISSKFENCYPFLHWIKGTKKIFSGRYLLPTCFIWIDIYIYIYAYIYIYIYIYIQYGKGKIFRDICISLDCSLNFYCKGAQFCSFLIYWPFLLKLGMNFESVVTIFFILLLQDHTCHYI